MFISEKDTCVESDHTPQHLEHELRQDAGLQKLEVANVDFAAAVTANKVSPWSKGSLKLYAFCVLVYLCSTMNGNDGSLMGAINVLPNYTRYHDLPAQGSTGTGLIGSIAGAFLMWTADWQGRRFLIFFGCAGVVIATIITSTAKNLSTFIGGRFLLSFFANIGTNAGSLYIVEITPPMYRGTVAGLFNTLYYMGSIIATFAIYGAHLHLSKNGNLDWRLPLWLQVMAHCPGSVRRGRQILGKHHADGDESHPLVELEMHEIRQSPREVGLTKAKTFFDLRVMFNTRSARYRTMINIAMSWFGQFSGNNVISYYLLSLLENVGITDPDTKLLLNAIYALTGWIAAIAGARCHDIFGRRQMFLGSAAGMVVCLAITAGTAAGYVNTGSILSSRASIAFIYIFGVVFAFSWTSMQPLYPIEVMSAEMRAKGVFIFQITAGLSGFVNTFAAPVALKNIGYWFCVFFVFWDVSEFFFMYCFFVATKGRTLEEMDAVFEVKNPRKARTRKVVVARTTVVDEEGNEHGDVIKVQSRVVSDDRDSNGVPKVLKQFQEPKQWMPNLDLRT
ncbi:related to transporter (major facilitator superfamily) [Phialocephala subalpina]|uniref:Related to transporter (Major facilitator superfamily) n=1 Tax=Phialocephala subalpina TaxID=576137 RepID=A0A1L7WS71_9HELO|nr:related to transporter (major facilitator superfamily) [Phialocephala subalpina]